MVSAALKKQNVRTVLGYVWWLLDPLLLMAVYVLLVSVLFKRGGEDYPVFVLTAVLAWKWFAGGVQQAMSFTVGRESLMRRAAFPRAVLPIAAVSAEALHFAFGLVALAAFAFAFGISPHPVLVLLPVVVLVQFALTLAVAFFLSALNVFFRDVAKLASHAFRVGFYLSPGLYALSSVPAEYRSLYELNPFATLFPAYRAIVMEHSVPDATALGAVAGGSLLLLLVGYAFFVRLAPAFTKVQ